LFRDLSVLKRKPKRKLKKRIPKTEVKASSPKFFNREIGKTKIQICLAPLEPTIVPSTDRKSSFLDSFRKKPEFATLRRDSVF